MPKNLYFQIVVLENTLKSLLDSKEIKLVSTKGNQSQMFIGRAGVEAEAPIHWATCVKWWLIEKDTDPGERLKAKKKKKRSEEQRMSWLDSIRDSMSKLRDSWGQRSLVCYSPWDNNESDMAS